MCTTIGHAFVGYSVLLGTRPSLFLKRWALLICGVAIGNLPDIDLIFGSFVGNPNRYHHLWTHSLAFCIVTGILCGCGYWLLRRRNGFIVGGIIFLVTLSHIVLDYFTKDTNSVKGIQLLWPLSKNFYISPLLIFWEIHKSSTNSTFIQSLLCWHNLWAIFIEIAILGPIQILLWIKYRMRKVQLVADL